MSGTIDVEYPGGVVPLTWRLVGDTLSGRAITTALRELADRMAADGTTIMGDSRNWPGPAREAARMYGLGWGSVLCAAWLQDALSAIEQGEDPREIG